MILEFDQGTIKVIPGVGKTSITIHPDSSIEISADGSITISSKTAAVSSVSDVSRYSDPAYLKTLGPITAQSVTASPGISMNQLYPGAMVSALDAGEKVRTEKLDVRTRRKDELLAHSGGLEKVGNDEVALPLDYAAFVKRHEGLEKYNAYPEWEDDPVAKLYKGTLEVPEHAAVGVEEDAIELEGRLNDYYSSAVLSDRDDEMRLFHSLQYLYAIGEDVEALLQDFDDEEIGPASSYLFALVQEHRRLQEVAQEEAIDEMNAETDAIIERGRLFMELLDRVMADPDNAELMAELDAFCEKHFGEDVPAETGAVDSQVNPVEEPELECSGNIDDFHVFPLLDATDLKGALDALIGSRHKNGEVETPEVPFAGAPVTEETVKSALDALGIGHFAKFNDPVHGYRGIWEGLDTLVGRGVKTFNEYVERSKE